MRRSTERIRAPNYEARLFELLEEAARWPEEKRQQLAEEACAGGPVPAAELLAALARDDQLDGFLETPAWNDHSGPDAASDEAESRGPGDLVGRYLLREPLGQGGMGQVFLAEQAEPFRRVALKLIRPEAVSQAMLDRFRDEQQALARLNHPHVAQFYEADVTEDGQPYFAMEWVDGQPIDEFLDARSVDLDTRLRVFQDVCAAVHHAHQRQVVHRDLKPSNILVREIDGRVVPKVIDFGIAEALDRPLGVVRTSGTGRIYGTPEYLSPESFEGDVDTRADVYSLGVLLYELLTGARPFTSESGDVSALIERIRRGEAPAPSVAVGHDSSLAFPSDADRARWGRRLRGDLDAIVRMAMHRDRDRRYGTVADLAADVERFLAYEPVVARPTGSWHELRLLLRRRRGTVVAAAIVLTSLVVGIFGATFGLVRARQEAKATRLALDESEELSQFLIDLFQESDPNRAQGAELTARELLDQGAERLETRLQGESLVRARLTRTIGDIYAQLEHYEEAEALLTESLRHFEGHYGGSHSEVARALHGLAVMHTKAGESEAAQRRFEQALKIQEANLEDSPSEVAMTAYHLGVLAYRAKDFDTAAVHFDRACGLWDEAASDEELRARCLQAFGALRNEQSRFDEARELYELSLQIRERILGPDHPHVAGSLESLCVLHTGRLQFDLAEATCVRSLDIRRRAFGARHSLVTGSVQRLARVHRMQGRYDEAEALLQEARDIVESLAKANPRLEAHAWNRLGWLSLIRGDYDEAGLRYGRAFEILGETLDSGLVTASSALMGLGLSHWKQGKLIRAERELLQAQHFFRERLGIGSSHFARASWGLAGIYLDRRDPSRGDLERAGELLRSALETRRRLHPEGHEALVLTEASYREYLELIEVSS